jgi:hypothetical protein
LKPHGKTDYLKALKKAMEMLVKMNFFKSGVKANFFKIFNSKELKKIKN